MDQSITSAGLFMGIAIGFLGGIAFAGSRRAWRDYKTSKAAIPGLRKKAWASTRLATTKVGIVGLLVVAAIVWAVVGAR